MADLPTAQAPSAPAQAAQAQSSTQAGTPLPIEDAFVADRQQFWGAFTNAAFYGVTAVVVVVIGMAIFLT